jgi:hypothetical protein
VKQSPDSLLLEPEPAAASIKVVEDHPEAVLHLAAFITPVVLAAAAVVAWVLAVLVVVPEAVSYMLPMFVPSFLCLLHCDRCDTDCLSFRLPLAGKISRIFSGNQVCWLLANALELTCIKLHLVT